MSDEDAPPEMIALLDGLSTLNAKPNEPWVCEAFRSAFESMGRHLGLRHFVDCLHKRWLTDVRIVWPAVQFCSTMNGQQQGNMSTLIHAVMLNDFRNRYELRKISRSVFANSARFMIDYFRTNYQAKLACLVRSSQRPAARCATNHHPIWVQTLQSQHQQQHRRKTINPDNEEVGRQVNPLLEDLIDLIFEYLTMLIDESAARTELILFHYTILNLGQLFKKYDAHKMKDLAMQLRRCLIQNATHPLDKALLLEAFEWIMQKGASVELLEEVQSFYAGYNVNHDIFVNYKISPGELENN